jgi:hypothetical protein
VRAPSTRRLASAPNHRSAWKCNSPKLVCRMPHSPARWLPYGRPETSRLRKVDHYISHTGRKMRSTRHLVRILTMRGPGVVRSLGSRVEYRRSGLPGIGVDTSRFAGRNTRLGPSDRRGPTPRLQWRLRRLWRSMVEVSRSGTVRGMIFCHKIQQNTARIDRTARNVAFCRTFLRALVQ